MTAAVSNATKRLRKGYFAKNYMRSRGALVAATLELRALTNQEHEKISISGNPTLGAFVLQSKGWQDDE